MLILLATMIDIGIKWKVHNPYVTAAIAVMGGMLFGFDISSMSSFISKQPFIDYFGTVNPVTGAKEMQATRQAGITSSMPGGSFLGSLASGYLSDTLGRKPTLQMASWLWMIGSAIQCSSQNITQLIFGRVIAGFGIGLASSQVPVYIAELSPKRIRGALVGCFQWAVTWGTLIMFYIGFGCGYVDSPSSFRIAWGIEIVPGLLFFLGTLILEESPRWLASQGHWDKALKIVADVQAKGDIDNDTVKVEFEEIKEAIVVEQNSNFKFWDLFRGRINQRRTFVGVTCQMWQQLTGGNVDMYYITTIFSFAGFEGNANLVASSIQYVIIVVMTIPAVLFFDRWGRRPLLYWGAFIMMIWMIAMAAVLGVYSVPIPDLNGNPQIRITIPKSDKSASNGVIAIAYLFAAAFSPTWGPGTWVYCSEIFPLEQRAVANGLCAAVNWIFNFAIGMFTPAAFVNITWRTYIIFSVFCFVMAIHVFLQYPETQGLTLEEVSQLWEANIPAWKTSNWKPLVPDVVDTYANDSDRLDSMKYEGETQHIESSIKSSDETAHIENADDSTTKKSTRTPVSQLKSLFKSKY